jgi:hypothetical protein
MYADATVKEFLPSRNGFHFANFFQPVKYIFRFLGIPVRLGCASNGMCGGMIYSVNDHYLVGRLPALDREAPSRGAFFEYLCQRLLDSFNLPLTPLRYYFLMTPLLRNEDRIVLLWKFGLLLHGKGWRMAETEWIKVKREIDQDRLCPIGIILKTSWNPEDIGHNHQVLVYGYIQENNCVQLRLYDPNYPDDDGVRLSFDIVSVKQGQAADYRTSGGNVVNVTCFFQTHYRQHQLPVD